MWCLLFEPACGRRSAFIIREAMGAPVLCFVFFALMVLVEPKRASTTITDGFGDGGSLRKMGFHHHHLRLWRWWWFAENRLPPPSSTEVM